MKFQLERLPSPIGTLLLVSDGEVLRAVEFEDFAARMSKLLRRYHGEHELVAGKVPRAMSDALRRFFAGDIRAVDAVPVATGGSEFQRRVWMALREIGAGATESYGALAARIGHPKASRAVGLANGANPICIVLPCHRVIGADGSLTGYGGGIERKRWLLAHERASVARQAA